ncbi:S41 family peptidase [Nesterenkonia sp.]|uniref:S41 family peptidase n=1 Tax=Nesterenkonia sp. TaxID=704201 RepID=UPI00262874E7|nr:S41 family peptidase [Nesterenkonia sp.]
MLLSSRTFDPAYDEHSFDHYFTGSVRPWLIPLAASQPPPFGPSAEGWPLSGGAAEAAAGKAAAGDEHSGQSTTPASDADSAPGEQPPRSPDVDPEAEQRLVPFPVASDAYRDLRAARGGVLWVKESRDEGELGSRRAQASGEKTPDQLIRWDFESRKSLTLAQKVTSYAVCSSGERVVVRHEDSVTVVPAVRTVEEDDAERVTVDLSRLRLQVDPAAEWRQMFAETHRLMAQQYWREDMDGVDWDAVGRRWRPVVEKVRCHSDLTDLLWEMVGELNTSHAYVLPQGEAPGAERALGLLGADLSSCDHGWRIDRILPGDSSDPKARSPLLAAGVGAREGDVITAVDGHPVDPVSGPAKHLVGAAEKPVELTLRREGAERRVVVVPVADEAPLRYQDWVRSRRDYVAAASGGRLGYVHVPDMQSTGWAQLHRDLHKASRAEGIIADMRFNGGGHTSQLVIEKLAQRVVAWNTVRHQPQALPYPESARRGPVVLVANEYSGSDGDIVNAVAQTLDIGPVVGVRTWGGVIGIDGRFDLVDGTRVTQPKYSYWIGRYGWGVENHGVDPDIEVIHDPGQLFTEEDPQLDRAVAEALRGLERTPAAAAPDLPAPRVADSAG